MDSATANNTQYWKKCSVCKKPIGFNQAYQICSVSTCQGKRTGLTFCSVECWDAHLGFARHRSSWAEECLSPSRDAYQREMATAHSNPTLSSSDSKPAPRRIITRSPESSAPSRRLRTETLVVVSKVKQLIREQSHFNTSQCAIDALTVKVIQECLKGIDAAREAGRKTVMGRDIE